MVTKENYTRWLNSPLVSNEDKEIIRRMSEEEIDDAFFKDVEFGTAGMRGVLGPGTNRLNLFTIKKATIGFAKYLIESFKDAKRMGVVISHDNRFMSREFTLESARVLNDFGIKCYIFDSLRPTPELSFAVRHLKAVGGIMITASHNPKQYNGYKVYDETGCQLIPSKIDKLLNILNKLPNELDVTYVREKVRGELVVLDDSIDDIYVSLVEGITLNKDLNKNGFKIVFTPNHGTSYVNAMRIFSDLGYEVYPVLSQCDPDPNFSGTLSPNPEDERSFIKPIELAHEIDADLIVMTDPDGDRVGLGYKNRNGEYKTLTGNQSAAMLMDYIFNYKKDHNLLSKDGVMYNTIVTSSLGEKIASYYGVKNEQFLTGFKFIGNRIDYYEKHGGPTFEFGYEESYGCLIAPFARDKDGLQAITLYSEMALYYHLLGKTLDVVWDEIGERFGYHEDVVFNIAFSGSLGQKKMIDLMNSLRKDPFIKIDDIEVNKVNDYLLSKSYSKSFSEVIDLPKSDVIKLFFNDGTTITVRPSGTEPKIKFYIGCVFKSKPMDDNKIKELYSKLLSILGI